MLFDFSPRNIDIYLFGFRFIIDLSWKSGEVSLLNAEVLDSDWELMLKATRELEKEISEMVVSRSIEHQQSLEQEMQIKKDRTQMF